MERKVGEIFEYNGEWYQCIHTKSLGCENCDLATKSDIHCSDVFEIRGECLSCYRKDGKSVIFKKLEKVGEPYMSNGHLMQTLSGEKQPNSIRDYKTRMCYYANCILRIEIKQNKEDMEEKKLNFKPFDLEAAKAGKPVCTRDGRKARIICFDAKCNKPIVALIYDCNKETVLQYLENGRFFVDQIDKYDLMMFPQKKEGWVNVYKSYNVGKKIPCMASIYPTKEEAKKSSVVGFDYVDTVKIEWEE
mgnify:CR=1 FL=1|jgi:hypothetical protein